MKRRTFDNRVSLLDLVFLQQCGINPFPLDFRTMEYEGLTLTPREVLELLRDEPPCQTH